MLNYISRRCISIQRGKFIRHRNILITIFRINYCLFLFFCFLRSFLTSFGTFCLRQSIRLSSLSFLNCFNPTNSCMANTYFLLGLRITVFFIIFFFFFLRFNFLVPTSLSCIILIIFSLHSFFLAFFLLTYLRRLNLISFL